MFTANSQLNKMFLVSGFVWEDTLWITIFQVKLDRVWNASPNCMIYQNDGMTELREAAGEPAL